ncbi:MAG: signal transduction histidine kinase/CheY-like chemotaxis protein [Gammaproteobacteria bacterium]|jgi:signal transduction histidine kinase/CheY-like chemotaxis protein
MQTEISAPGSELLERVERTLAGAPSDEKFELALTVIREAFGADRAWLDYPCDPNALSFLVAIESFDERFPGLGSASTPIAMSGGMKELMTRVLASGEAIGGPGQEHPALPFESAQHYRVQSRLCIAVRSTDGMMWLFGLHQCRSQREWSQAEVALFSAVARLFEQRLSVNALLECFRREANRRTHAERALAHNEERFRDFAAVTADWFWETDAEHRYVYRAGRFPDGAPRPAEAIGRTCAELHANNPHMSAQDWQSHLNDLAHRRAIHGFRLRLARSDESLAAVCEINGRPRFDDMGRFIGYRGTGRDVSSEVNAEQRRRQLELELRQAQKMQSLGELTGGIAHDFNNVLAVVLGYAELAKESVAKNAQADISGYLREVLTAGERGHSLVKQMLTFTRQGAEGAEPVDCKRIVLESVDMLRATLVTSADIRFEHSAEHGALAVEISAVSLMQIVMNLCINARDSLNGHGEILIQQRIRHTEEFYCAACHTRVSGEYVCIMVTDTGAGMSSETRGRIFQPFFTTKNIGAGTGMGLSVVHGLVHEAKGHLRVDSTLGKGTSVEVLLPLSSAALEAPDEIAKARTPELANGGGARVLVVDDEAPMARFVAEVLEAENYRVTMTTDARAARAFLDSAPDLIDLLITDQTMPHFLGDELVRAALARRPELPIIVCSGLGHEVNGEWARTLGARSLLRKPFSARELLDDVEAAMAQ